MLNRFSRTELLLGEENMSKLAQSKIAIFGIGGGIIHVPVMIYALAFPPHIM
jgi:tRNA A37 threonylcarbamoyladenosine dehydratase